MGLQHCFLVLLETLSLKRKKWWFVIFLVIFPVLVLFVFAYLVINHHQKLYAPSDYRDEKNFFGYSSPKEQEEKIEKRG
ncbi:MAG: hypothetical protein MR958_04930 [Spirochaetia bacterium]|nr:hypothetical protein [Spirochaetia bacterium]MDY3885995.1 hypothetical protein [Treponema sp.]